MRNTDKQRLRPRNLRIVVEEEPTDAERAEMAELDAAAKRAFNPDNMVHVELLSGAVACVSPDVSQETLAALDRMCALAAGQFGGGNV